MCDRCQTNEATGQIIDPNGKVENVCDDCNRKHMIELMGGEKAYNDWLNHKPETTE